MSASKKLVPIVLGCAIGLSWYHVGNTGLKQYAAYHRCITGAEESYEKKLYVQAVEQYKESLQYRYNSDVYHKIMEIDQVYYLEEPSQRVYLLYVSDMLEAAEADTGDPVYWKKVIELYKENEDYKKAYAAAKKACDQHPRDEDIRRLYTELRYMTHVSYKRYTAFKSALNDFISLYDGENWWIADDTGEITSIDSYQFIGLLDDEGRGFFKNQIDIRFLDIHEITRARFDLNIKEAGCYSARVGYTPVLINGAWRYVDLDGSFLTGEYECAGSFYNGKAAVKQNGEWFLIDTEGQKVSECYEEIGLDLYGSYQQGDVILAKKAGAWHIYDETFEQISSFGCDDMDICLENGLIAFCQGKKWGFVNTKGNVAVEPVYSNAKSFSKGMAAVCLDGKWGFINDTYELVIPCQFEDAFYFNSRRHCMVSTEAGSYQFMNLMFD